MSRVQEVALPAYMKKDHDGNPGSERGRKRKRSRELKRERRGMWEATVRARVRG